VPPGGNLSLNIGWDRFEHLMVFVAEAALGLLGVKFRSYGTPGQAQQGIDLAGKRADDTYVVVQCKDFKNFTVPSLRKAVRTFVDGSRPFDSKHLIVAVSCATHTTQLEDELAVQRTKHPDLIIDLWGAEEINDVLRERNDIVSRFWTRETADTFCTAAPKGGVGAPAPNLLRLSEMILLGPAKVDGLVERIDQAEQIITAKPADAAIIFGEVAQAITSEGFPGNAEALRRQQLDALELAGRVADLIDLAATLAVAALHAGDTNSTRSFVHRIETAIGKSNHQEAEAAEAAKGKKVKEAAAAAAKAIADQGNRHVGFLRAGMEASEHPRGEKQSLTNALRATPKGARPDYYSVLVLLLAEFESADRIFALPGDGLPEPHTVDPGATEHLDDLIRAALEPAALTAAKPFGSDIAFRLKLVQARYSSDLRTKLLNEARMLTLSRPHSALILGKEARRGANRGVPADAIQNWRQAVQHAIQEGLTDDASGWLYSLRAVRVEYGPWTDDMNLEHYLAQGLPRRGGASSLRRTRDPETRSYREALQGKPHVAVNAVRRWLADSIVLSDWTDESAAIEMLGDLLAQNAEPGRAALCYQWAGRIKKLELLSQTVGDFALPVRAIDYGPWWVRRSAVKLLAAQEDLLDDDAAKAYLTQTTDLANRGRNGELNDPHGHLTLEVLRTACALAGRGTPNDAKALLDSMAQDVDRAPNTYTFFDKQHVDACLSIASHHPSLANTALERIFALADVGCDDAVNALGDNLVLALLRTPDDPKSDDHEHQLTATQRNKLRTRIAALADSGQYRAAIAACSLRIQTTTTDELVSTAVTRLRDRPEPNPNMFSPDGHMVPDSYLITRLAPQEAPTCLERLMKAAEDRGEAAINRASALTAGRNLIYDVDTTTRRDTFERAKLFATGDQDGSHLDDQMTNPHPLSSMQVNLGPATLRGPGLRLAASAADTREQRSWVAQQAATALRGDDDATANDAAHALHVIGTDIDTPPDPGLLAAHPNPTIKALAAVYAAADPVKYAFVLEAGATDPDFRVRRSIADALRRTTTDQSEDDIAVCNRVLHRLAGDPRHTVRRAAMTTTT
jgi:hypothetical protein